jgi:hypothetical protein
MIAQRGALDGTTQWSGTETSVAVEQQGRVANRQHIAKRNEQLIVGAVGQTPGVSRRRGSGLVVTHHPRPGTADLVRPASDHQRPDPAQLNARKPAARLRC